MDGGTTKSQLHTGNCYVLIWSRLVERTISRAPDKCSQVDGVPVAELSWLEPNGPFCRLLPPI